MITYFNETDLVSFGTFLLSEARKEAYLKQGIDSKKVTEVLTVVNSFDLTTWFNLVVKAGKEQVAVEQKTVQNPPQDNDSSNNK